MPDPILTLADLSSPVTFNLNKVKGRVIPQFIDAVSTHHHTNTFYVEYPADHSGSFYQIQGSKLVAITGDGGTRRHFKADHIAEILSKLWTGMNHRALLNSISIPFAN